MSIPRTFDHEEAVRRYTAGESVNALAAEYGVTSSAIRMAFRRSDPAGRAADNLYGKLYQRRTLRKPCVRGCGGQAWHHPGREGVCNRCRSAERATTVREAELHCAECGEWKPDADFPKGQGLARRRRHALCRACQTIAKRRYRARTRAAA